MRDIPIIFSAPMVRALLDGRKTMTRRLAWRVLDGKATLGGEPDLISSPWQKVKPGDRLWVRENFHAAKQSTHPALTFYAADGDCGEIKLTPSIHMPRWASRLTLVVTATKIERLKEISGRDSIAEGVECPTCTAMGKSACNRLGCFASKGAFAELWCRLHGRESWDANPEVVALTFTVHRCNIDSLPPQPASFPQAAAPGGDPTTSPGKPFNERA